jgi:NTE family protein
VFDHGAMRDIWNVHGVQVWLNATDLYNGTTFAFAPVYFQALCSDLGSVRIADAVASSMAFPLAFRPVLLAPYPTHCELLPAWTSEADDHEAPALVRRTAQAFAAYRDPARQPYLHLVDGGVLDNLGLTSLSLMRETAGNAYGPLTARDAVRVRRLTFLVINAEQARRSTWQRTARGPNGSETAGALFGIAIESPNRSAYDSFRLLMADWERDLRAYRCGLAPDEVVRLRGSLHAWNCGDIHIAVDMLSFADLDEATRTRIGNAPTRVTLPSETVDVLIEAGRSGVQANATAAALTR